MLCIDGCAMLCTVNRITSFFTLYVLDKSKHVFIKPILAIVSFISQYLKLPSLFAEWLFQLFILNHTMWKYSSFFIDWNCCMFNVVELYIVYFKQLIHITIHRKQYSICINDTGMRHKKACPYISFIWEF